ncbi:MAG: hypothetical protein HOE48_22485 [Candidatus Latescibacteria bacterium]|nr:hypothetical protein [Candidatus Latescibacterota bacterium]
MRRVVVVDSVASVSVDSLKAEFKHVVDLLAVSEASAIDSMKKSASSMGPAVKTAQRNLRQLRGKYKNAFQKMQKFRSFGGNPVFTDDDIGVSTKKLQSEIVGRFYKGRAFSLETQSQIRSFIRKDLAPIEQKVSQAKSRVNRLRRSQSGRSQATAQITGQYHQKRKLLIAEANHNIKRRILSHQVLAVDTDSAGAFIFDKTPAGLYSIFVQTADSSGFLIPLEVFAHTRRDIVPGPSLENDVSVYLDFVSAQ